MTNQLKDITKAVVTALGGFYTSMGIDATVKAKGPGTAIVTAKAAVYTVTFDLNIKAICQMKVKSTRPIDVLESAQTGIQLERSINEYLALLTSGGLTDDGAPYVGDGVKEVV